MFSKEQIQKDLAFLITDERVVNKLREIYFKKNYLVYYTEILKYTENYDMTFVQRVYHYFNQIKHPITETKCICCNKVLPVKFQFFKTVESRFVDLIEQEAVRFGAFLGKNVEIKK